MSRYEKIRNIGLFVLAFIGLFSFITFGFMGLIFYIICILIPSLYGWNRTDRDGNKRDKGM